MPGSTTKISSLLLRTLFPAILFYLSAGVAHAQEQVTKRTRADQLFERLEYSRSLGLYLDLAKKKHPDVVVLARIAECYDKMSRYREAETWYAKALANPRADLRLQYEYARILQINQQFENAKEQYKKYFARTRKPAELAAKLAGCDSAAAWMAVPAPFKVENAGQLNSEVSDWGTSFYDGALVFTSDRKVAEARPDKKSDNIYPWTGNGWSRLYQAGSPNDLPAEFTLATGGSTIFESPYHIGPITANAKGDTAYLTLTTALPGKQLATDPSGYATTQRLYTRRLELVMAIKSNNQWKKFSRFPYSNSNQWSVGHAALSPDGQLLYFTSDMPGGEGKTDIWYCQKLPNGNWGKPVNCGKTINTREEEAFPTIGNGLLYFASKGQPGMGGFDLFSAAGSKNTWSRPVNLRYPLNSTADDFWMTTTNGSTGYFSSNREGGKGGDDIYTFSYQAPPVHDPVVQAPPVASSTAPAFPPEGKDKGKPFVLRDIYYDLDQSFIRPDAALELDKLVAILQQHPALRIELSSHTDSRAPDEYNLRLSQRRAEAAVAYLVQKGIPAARLVAKGYGETQLLNRCANDIPCSEAEHQLNRRTEIRVLDEN